MIIALHKNATTTPALRKKIALSLESVATLAERYNLSEDTICRWRCRDSLEDRSHTGHRLQTTLTTAHEVIVLELRRMLLLPLDDLLAITRDFLNQDVCCSGLNRCLRRHGVGNLNALKQTDPKVAHKSFKAYEPGYLHVDVKYLSQMPDETKRRYLFVAIDRATRWVFVSIMSAKTAANAKRFLKQLSSQCPIKIHNILTDNGKEFTERLFASLKRGPTGQHEIDQLCAQLNIEH